MTLVWALGGTALAVLACAYAFWKGGLPERYGAAILFIGWFLTPLVDAHGGASGQTPGIGIVLVDIGALVAFVILSLWSRRIWTLFASAFQLAAVASHGAAALSSQISLFSYVTGLGIWGGYGLVFALAGGVWAYDRDRSAKLAKTQVAATE